MTRAITFGPAMRRSMIVAALLASIFVSGCSKKSKRVVVPTAPRSEITPPPKIGDTEEGTASWYGHPYHGRRAANGEIYDMEKMTAAHRTLPFETWVDVENMKNGKTVKVRITDRGPFIDGRIIDLSHAAAREIEMIGPGTAPVKLTVVASPPPSVLELSLFAVQVGAFQDRDRAERIRQEFEQQYGAARLVARAGNPVLWRVLVGRETSEERATALAESIRTTSREAFVVRLDEPPPVRSEARE